VFIIPATRAVVAMGMVNALKYRTVMTVDRAKIIPSDVYRSKKRIYFMDLFSVMLIIYNSHITYIVNPSFCCSHL